MARGDRGSRAVATVRLLGEPRDVGIARAFLRRLLDQNEAVGDGHDVVVVLSELVTAAVVRGRAPIDVGVRLADGVVELRVSDSGPADPGLCGDGGDPCDEHGMVIVAGLSTAWSVEATDRGTTVTATVPLGPLPGG